MIEPYRGLLGLKRQPPPCASYAHVLRGAGYAWWRAMAGVLLALALYVWLARTVGGVRKDGYAAVGQLGSWSTYLVEAQRLDLSVGMLGTSLAFAALIPLTAGLMRVLHRIEPCWLSSVAPGVRWRYLFVCTGIAIVVLVSGAVLPALVTGGLTWTPQAGLMSFVVLVALTAPLQAAAEEYFFRGYLLQALGSLDTARWTGVALSALLFAAFQGSQSLVVFVDRLALGLVAGALVVLTGGLEAGIGLHIADNVAAYSAAALTSSIGELRAVGTPTWPDGLHNVGGLVLVAVLALLVARRRGLRTITPMTRRGLRARPHQRHHD